MPREAQPLAPGVSAGVLPDAELVARCRQGDQDAWGQLVERFSRYVYAIATRGFRISEHDSEDVFQEVFARTYEKLDTLRDDAAIRPFIAQLTRRLAIDRQRATARVEPREDVAETLATGEDQFARLDEAMSVQEALATLPENCREILDRFFAQDQSYSAISEALEIPSGTIASRISRCLAKLRVEIEGRETPSPASREG